MSSQKLGYEVYEKLGRVLLNLACASQKKYPYKETKWYDTTATITSIPVKAKYVPSVETYMCLRFLHTDPEMELFAIELVEQKSYWNEDRTAAESQYTERRVYNLPAIILLLQEHGIKMCTKHRYYEF